MDEHIDFSLSILKFGRFNVSSDDTVAIIGTIFAFNLDESIIWIVVVLTK